MCNGAGFMLWRYWSMAYELNHPGNHECLCWAAQVFFICSFFFRLKEMVAINVCQSKFAKDLLNIACAGYYRIWTACEHNRHAKLQTWNVHFSSNVRRNEETKIKLGKLGKRPEIVRQNAASTTNDRSEWRALALHRNFNHSIPIPTTTSIFDKSFSLTMVFLWVATRY